MFVLNMSFIRAFQLVLTIFALASYPCRAELTYTIAYIESLLKEGKSVAILLVDMQKGLFSRFMGQEIYDVIRDQVSLIEALASKENVHFINVKFEGQGDTLVELQFQLKKTAQYSTLLKKQNDAFEKNKLTIEKPLDSNAKLPTDLKTYLQDKNIENIVIVGCFDSICVRSTAKAAAKEGLQVVVDRDLNIMLDKMIAVQIPEATTKQYLEVYQQEWDELREEYPNLLVFDPVRYGNCELKED